MLNNKHDENYHYGNNISKRSDNNNGVDNSSMPNHYVEISNKQQYKANPLSQLFWGYEDVPPYEQSYAYWENNQSESNNNYEHYNYVENVPHNQQYDPFESNLTQPFTEYNDDNNAFINPQRNNGNNFSSNDVAPYTIKISKVDLLEFLLSKFMEEQKFLSCDSILLLYEPSKGYYLPLQKQDFEVFVKKHSNEQIIHIITKNIAAELYTSLLSKTKESSFEEIQAKTEDYINFLDCAYCISQNRLLSPKPDLPFLNCINVQLGATNNSNPVKFLEFLNTVTFGNREMQSMLVQLGGYLLTDKNIIKSGFFFVGPTNTGKSSYLSFLTKIIGSNNVSAIPLHELGGKFETVELLGKKANIASEIKNEVITEVATYKKLTGAVDFVKGEKKYQNPMKFIPKAKLIFAANTLPHIENETTDAIYKRFIFIPFERIIKEEDRIHQIEDILMQEAPAIIKLFLKGLNDLAQNNYRFPVCTRSEQLFDRFILENNSLKYFFDKYTEISYNNQFATTFDSRFRTSKTSLLNVYLSFCAELAVKPFDFDYIKTYITNTYGIQYKKLKVENNSNKTLWGFDGIRIINRLNQQNHY